MELPWAFTAFRCTVVMAHPCRTAMGAHGIPWTELHGPSRTPTGFRGTTIGLHGTDCRGIAMGPSMTLL